MDVITKEAVNIDVGKIIFDDTNPNVMRPEQLASLKQSLQKYGNLHPVVLDADSMVVADGFHRVLAYKELGMSTIPAILVHFQNENERRLCRQVMNKLHGEHDPTLDIKELTLLMEYSANQMNELLQIDQSYMDNLIQLNNEQREIVGTYKGVRLLQPGESEVLDGNNMMIGRIGSDMDPSEYHENSFLQGNVKQVVLVFSNQEFLEMMPRVKEAMIDLNVANNTDLFFALIEFYEKYRDMAADMKRAQQQQQVEQQQAAAEETAATTTTTTQ